MAKVIQGVVGHPKRSKKWEESVNWKIASISFDGKDVVALKDEKGTFKKRRATIRSMEEYAKRRSDCESVFLYWGLKILEI